MHMYPTLCPARLVPLAALALSLSACQAIRLGTYEDPAAAEVVADTSSGYTNNLRVDVVVDVTDAGKSVSRPSPDHPVYYYPVTPGYTEGGKVMEGEKPPPPTVDVQHLVAKALYEQGYKVMNRTSAPSLLLVFWWGYKAPVIMDERSTPLTNFSSATPGAKGLGGAFGGNQGSAADEVFGLALRGMLPANLVTNHTEMEELVMGSKFAADNPLQNHPGPRLETAISMSRYPRYYLMVSALDFKAALKKQYVVLWTARVSTELTGHTLDEVLPSLIAAGAPMFGRDTDGPAFSDRPVVPAGRVEMGTPVPKK
jgi:hypothetical protein